MDENNSFLWGPGLALILYMRRTAPRREAERAAWWAGLSAEQKAAYNRSLEQRDPEPFRWTPAWVFTAIIVGILFWFITIPVLLLTGATWAYEKLTGKTVSPPKGDDDDDEMRRHIAASNARAAEFAGRRAGRTDLDMWGK